MAGSRSGGRFGECDVLRSAAHPSNRKQIVVLARSTDSGRTFSNFAWTEEPFEAGGVFFGDYSGLAAYGGRGVRSVDREANATDQC